MSFQHNHIEGTFQLGTYCTARISQFTEFGYTRVIITKTFFKDDAHTIFDRQEQEEYPKDVFLAMAKALADF